MDRLRQIAAQRFFGRLIIRECRNDEKEGVWVDIFLFSSQILLAKVNRDFFPTYS